MQLRVMAGSWVLPIGKRVPRDWECFDEQEIVIPPGNQYALISTIPLEVPNPKINEVATRSTGDALPAYLV